MKTVDIAIISPTPEEWLAVKAQIRDAQVVAESAQPTVRGTIGIFSVVAVQTGKGELNSAAGLQEVFHIWRPRTVLLVGIAGGFAEEKVYRGDLVIATTIHHFDYGKLTAGTFRRRPEDDIKCDLRLLRSAQTVAVEQAARFHSELALTRPDGRASSATAIHRDCYVASSSKVVDDPSHSFFADVKRFFPEIHAVEMEGAGAGASVWLEQAKRQVSFLMIRGISDQPTAAQGGSSEVGVGSSQRKEWKAFASTAAAVFVRIFLEHGLTTPDDPNVLSRSGERQASPEEAALKQLAARKYFSASFRRFPTRPLKQIGLYNKLFSLCQGEQPYAGARLVEHLAQQIRDSNHPYPLRIDGPPGIGKSTLLILLYMLLQAEYESGVHSDFPVYIDLKYYDRLAGDSSDLHVQAKEAIRKDLAPLIELGNNYPELQIICLVDGIEEYVRLRDPVEDELLTLLRSLKHRKVVGLGLMDGVDAESFRRTLGEFSEPDQTVVLQTIPPVKFEEFVDIFLKLELGDDNADSTTDKATLILERLRFFGLRSLDLFTVSIMARKTKLCGESPTFSAFLRSYCETFINAESGRIKRRVSINDACTLAFRYAIKREELRFEEVAGDPCWPLLHQHENIRHFLIANHVISCLRGIAEKTEYDVADLQFVFPQHINHFGKEIINGSPRAQRDMVRGARYAFDKGRSEDISPHVCYLIGRVVDREAQLQAVALLKEWKKRVLGVLVPMPHPTRPRAKKPRIAPHMPTEAELPHLLLLARTIYISLAYLGVHDASDEYIGHLLKRESWDVLNRGFHLEYYNDIPYVPRDKMSHSDPLCPFPNTLRILSSRVQTAIREEHYPLRDIEIYTLISLAQTRQAAGVLNEKKRLKLKDLIEQVLKSSAVKFPPLVDYLRMMHQNLARTSFKIGQIGHILLKLKSTRRAGWIRRGINDGESVADHTFGAYILGLTYLPESRSWDKREVLDMLLIHDLGEAIIGDLLPDERNDEARTRERRAFEYFGALATYDGVHGLDRARSLWEKFEAQSSYSARIALDLDRVENLMQLHTYKSEGRVIEDFESWRISLRQALATREGRSIADTIEQYFGYS